MQSIFDLSGPYFLVFYCILGLIVLFGLIEIRRRLEGGTPATIDLSDPYLIACLRGGKAEVLRVAVVSLVDRGLLTLNGTLLSSTPEAIELVRRPVERAIQRYFRNPSEALSVLGDPGAQSACESFQRELASKRLLPNEHERRTRWQLTFAGWSILAFFGITKLLIALERGKNNVGLLVFLCFAFAVLTWWVTQDAIRTARGDARLRQLTENLSHLKARATSIASGGATGDLVLLAAAFGLSAVPRNVFPYADTLFQSQSSVLGDGSSSSCGSGCGGGCGGCS